MKKFILSFLLLILVSGKSIVSAQHDSVAADTSKKIIASGKTNKENSSRIPQKGDIGFTFNFIGFLDTISIGGFKDHIGNDFLLFRYYSGVQSALRMGFGVNLLNEKWSWVDSAGSSQVKRDSSYKRADIYFSPGYEKHFGSGKNLDPYLAATVSLGKIGRTKIRNTITTTDTTGVSISDFTSDKDGGYSVGINLIAGFNYFFSEKISIGAEYGFGINSARYGGDWAEVTIDTPASGSQTVKRKVGSESVNSTKFKMNSTAGIMLSYFF